MKTFLVVILVSIGVALADSVSEKDSSSSSGDHEESEQMQAFVIADPSQSASSSSASSSSSSSDDDGPESVNPLAASLLLNLALNNMAATMPFPPGLGAPFRSSKSSSSDCDCGCKCGHGSRGLLCPACVQRSRSGYPPCPCGAGCTCGLREGRSMDNLVSAGSYFYPLYFDPSSGMVLPGQERASQMQNPWTPIAAATYSRPTYVARPRYYYSPYPVQPAMAASYPVPTYAYPPASYMAAPSTPVYAYVRPSPPIVMTRRSSYMMSPYPMPKYMSGYF